MSAGVARTLARALRFVAPLRVRVLGKLALVLASVVPLVLVAWPGKIVIDHVIEGRPVVPASYPWFVRPFAAALEGAGALEILLWTLAAQLVLLVVVGALGAGGRERDEADAWLAGGHDTQTRTENEANAGFSLAGGLLGLWDVRYTMRLTQDLNHHFRARLFERLQALPMRAFDDERIGDAVYRVMIDTPSITSACWRILITPIAAPVVIAMAAAALHFAYGDQPALVWAALGALPVAFLATLPFAASMRRRSLGSREAGSVTTSTAEEGLAQVLAVQSLGGGGRERGRFDRDSWQSFGRYRAVLRTGIAAFLLGLVPGAALAGYAFLHAIDLVIGGTLSRGDFLVVFTYYTQAAIAALSLGSLWFELQGASAGLERVFGLLDLPAEADAPGVPALAPLREGVRFEEVSYRHADGTLAVDAVSFEARVGELVAIAGPAGAGKTTLAHLLPRYLAPSAGRVLADGTDLAAVSLASLRAQVSYVFQETWLFDGTIEENLRLGAPGAGEAAVARALRLARADEFVARLPEGLATRVGRGGSQLSVGQRQRLAIARALVRETPILILDEPTSALDPETEQALVASLREAGRGRLVLVIAHRLSTIRAADRIVFLAAGRLVEQGTHDELAARPGGAYRRFLDLQ
ncbi:MAG: ABC transporter ATP-binding protein [Deltaproteobacteria bacterium]|nr:ABC transporter ATP-binding protein [Deltaproteobacteria bacterium]